MTVWELEFCDCYGEWQVVDISTARSTDRRLLAEICLDVEYFYGMPHRVASMDERITRLEAESARLRAEADQLALEFGV